MREIKFRAWDGEKMVSPSYIARNGAAYWKENSIPETSNVVMQYTGLKDKNGVEIYESDVVAYGSSILSAREIVWHEGDHSTGWRARRASGSLTDISQMTTDSMVVIGNVYENPELLEDE